MKIDLPEPDVVGREEAIQEVSIVSFPQDPPVSFSKSTVEHGTLKWRLTYKAADDRVLLVGRLLRRDPKSVIRICLQGLFQSRQKNKGHSKEEDILTKNRSRSAYPGRPCIKVSLLPSHKTTLPMSPREYTTMHTRRTLPRLWNPNPRILLQQPVGWWDLELREINPGELFAWADARPNKQFCRKHNWSASMSSTE